MKRTLSALGLGLALMAGVAACAQAGPAGFSAAGQPGAIKAAGLKLDSAPLGAALVTSRFGWVLTSSDLLLTTNGGASFQAAKISLPDGPARAAYFTDANHGWVAAASGTRITVVSTADGGSTWTSTVINGIDEVGSLSVSFGDQMRGALLAGRLTSSNFSMGTVYSTVDGGRAWTPSQAPVNGSVTVDSTGAIWLAGGVFGNQLFGSADAGHSWAAQKLDVSNGSVESVGVPTHGTVTATVTDGVATHISVLALGPDSTWNETASVGLAWDPGAAPALAGYDSTVVLVDPTGKHLYRSGVAPGGQRSATASSLSATSTTGLPVGAMQASFIDTNAGWVLASYGSCVGAKSGCTYTTQVTSTADGGKSWRAVATYQE